MNEWEITQNIKKLHDAGEVSCVSIKSEGKNTNIDPWFYSLIIINNGSMETK